MEVRSWRTHDVQSQPFFVLSDLWESFKEWSAYGVGVPLILHDRDGVVQYYVPYLSGIQLYADLSKSTSKLRYLSLSFGHTLHPEFSFTWHAYGFTII